MENKIKILRYQNYLAVIKASRGSRMFRHIYILVGGKKRDVVKGGFLSCALFVSSILKIFDLISMLHATVESTIDDMLKNGWRRTKKLKPGNVLLWEEKDGHKHLGFYLGKDKAISNSSEKKSPVIHHFTFGRDRNNHPRRRIIQIFTHKIIRHEI